MSINFQLRLLLVTLTVLLVGGACTGNIVDPTPSGGSDSLPADAAGSGQESGLCPLGQLDCGGRCVDSQNDQGNCGACGTVCGAGTLCQAGECATFCATGQLACAEGCATVQSDLANCGACGVACPAGQYCSAGVCAASCAFQPCDGKSGLECADIQTNPEHCGGCGAVCAPGQSCIGGICQLVCPADRAACGGECVQTQADSRHCGTCNNPCAEGVPCVGGACGCAPGQALCDGSCQDVLSNPLHCGVCEKACTGEELCEQGVCKPKTVGCSPGFSPCGGGCVDTTISNTHCGTCDNPCTAGRSCVDSLCECPEGQKFCGGACVDTGTSEAHCGDCDVACSAGRSCVGGMCECDGELEFCDIACVDTQSSNEHCGQCGEQCSGGQSCETGTCQCPDALTFCGMSCVDTQASDAHCNGCDKPCALGKTCVGGACTGGGGTGEDGCSGLGKNVTISQVAVYQSVKIPVMDGGAAIAPDDRDADVVVSRETMFRVFVTIGTGWVTRELSARLVLMHGETPVSYYQKKSISKSSTDNDTASTFQLFVPKAEISADTDFYVELVECGTTGTGSLISPRYPAGDAEAVLGARDTGGLKVTLIPITSNSRAPDTSTASLDVYRNYLLAMYPIGSLEMTVGGGLSTGYPIDWGGTLDQVRNKRQNDGPADDVYYYGLVAPQATFSQFCGGSCTTGIGYVTPQSEEDQRAALGVGFGDQVSASTMAHELGHNHGRNHAPCGGPSGVDGSYPYSNASIGVWGYDAREKILINPSNGTDIMGYCSNKWISDYTYNGLTNRVAYVNGKASVLYAAERFGTWRVLLLDAKGPRWGFPIDKPTPASGQAELAEVLDVAGDVIELVEVYRTEIGDLGGAMIKVPEPLPDWHAVRVAGWPALAFSAPLGVPQP